LTRCGRASATCAPNGGTRRLFTGVVVTAFQVVATVVVFLAVVTLFLAIVVVIAVVLFACAVLASQVVATLIAISAVLAFSLAVIIVIVVVTVLFARSVLAPQVVATVVVLVAIVTLVFAPFAADLGQYAAAPTLCQQPTTYPGGQQGDRLAPGRTVEQARPPVKLSRFHGRSSSAYGVRSPDRPRVQAPRRCALSHPALLNQESV
jgi:hypothetical protein